MNTDIRDRHPDLSERALAARALLAEGGMRRLGTCPRTPQFVSLALANIHKISTWSSEALAAFFYPGTSRACASA